MPAFTRKSREKLMSSRPKLLKIALVICLGMILLAGWLMVENHKATASTSTSTEVVMFTHQGDQLIVPNNSPLKARLKIAPASSNAAAHISSFPGIVEANTASTANIEPPLSGRLVHLNVKLGDHVQKGQVLATISSGDLAQAFSDVTKARDALSLADRALSRARSVNAAGANANKDLEAAESTHVQAQAEYDRAQQRVHTLSNHSGKIEHLGADALLPIIAPISGEVTALNVGQGSYINDNTAAIMTLTNLDRVWVTANIPENLLSEIHSGQAAEVALAAYPNQALRGTISSVSNILDSDTRRSKARIEFDNSGMRLKPNMFATVKVATQQQSQISIPPSALLMNNDSVTVFVEVKPNVFVRRTVEIGTEDEQHVQILSGLNPNDRIVIQGGVLLND